MFGPLGVVWDTILYEPILNILVWLYNAIPGHDFGVAIIVMTVLMKAILLPLTKKQLMAQKRMQDLQPEIKRIQEKYKENKQEQSKALMAFYQQNKVNPFSSCLPLIVQLLLFITLYTVFRDELTSNGNLEGIYGFIANPGQINHISFGFLDLSKPSIPLAVVAGALQFIQAKMMLPPKPSKKEIQKDVKKNDQVSLGQSFQSAMNTQMLYFFPLLTIFIGATFPSGLAVYWVVSTLFQVIQQKFIFRSPKTEPKEPAEGMQEKTSEMEKRP